MFQAVTRLHCIQDLGKELGVGGQLVEDNMTNALQVMSARGTVLLGSAGRQHINSPQATGDVHLSDNCWI